MPHDAEQCRLIEQACLIWEPDVRAFLNGVLRDPHATDDAFQRTVVKALETSSTPDPTKIRSWLLQIALNVARDHHRESKRNRNNARKLQQQFDGSMNDTATSSLLATERQQVVQEALNNLKQQYKDVVIRRIQRGQTFAEIAEDIDRPLGTVLTWMRRALTELRNMPTIRQLSDEDQHSEAADQ